MDNQEAVDRKIQDMGQGILELQHHAEDSKEREDRRLGRSVQGNLAVQDSRKERKDMMQEVSVSASVVGCSMRKAS